MGAFTGGRNYRGAMRDHRKQKRVEAVERNFALTAEQKEEAIRRIRLSK